MINKSPYSQNKSKSWKHMSYNAIKHGCIFGIDLRLFIFYAIYIYIYSYTYIYIYSLRSCQDSQRMLTVARMTSSLSRSQGSRCHDECEGRLGKNRARSQQHVIIRAIPKLSK